MAEFYAGLVTVAARMLDSKGQSVSFSREVGGTFDPVLGSQSGATTTAWTAKAVALSYRNAEIDGTLVQSGDVRLVAEYTTTEPQPNDICTVDSVVYRVIKNEPLSPAGTTVINTVQLRK